MCSGGEVILPSAHRSTLCELCSGTGELDSNEICACGRQAVYRKDGHAYCGREACLSDLARSAYNHGYTTYRDLTHFEPPSDRPWVWSPEMRDY